MLFHVGLCFGFDGQVFFKSTEEVSASTQKQGKTLRKNHNDTYCL